MGHWALGVLLAVAGRLARAELGVKSFVYFLVPLSPSSPPVPIPYYPVQNQQFVRVLRKSVLRVLGSWHQKILNFLFYWLGVVN